MKDHIPELLDAFEDGIYIINDDYIIEYMNKAIKALFGEGIGQKCNKTLYKSDTPCKKCKFDEVFVQHEAHNSEVYIESVDKMFALSELPLVNHDKTRSKDRKSVV